MSPLRTLPLLVPCLAAAPAAAQCEGRWITFPESGLDESVHALHSWDRDGPGPRRCRPISRSSMRIWPGRGIAGPQHRWRLP